MLLAKWLLAKSTDTVASYNAPLGQKSNGWPVMKKRAKTRLGEKKPPSKKKEQDFIPH